jgi:hypothetical protein
MPHSVPGHVVVRRFGCTGERNATTSYSYMHLSDADQLKCTLTRLWRYGQQAIHMATGPLAALRLVISTLILTRQENSYNSKK